MSSPSPPPSSPPSSSIEDLEWEEWDSQSSPLTFTHHCLAGSFAGVVEHTLLYPLDTVKTCWQSQVLNSGGGGSGGCGVTTTSECGVNTAVSRMRSVTDGVARIMSSSSSSSEGKPASSPSMSSNLKVNPQTSSSTSSSVASSSSSSSASHTQGIWSTMKHLMRQGHHHHHHHHPTNHQFSHAHVYTLAGNPPNVVDLTNTDAATASKDGSASKATRTTKRPWSKQSRALRNATIEDITAQGMIRSASGVASTKGFATAISFQPNNAAQTTTNGSYNNAGFKRLWRGVQTMFVGCIPAHALYFSSYEIIKSICTDGGGGHSSEDHNNNNSNDGGHVGHDTLSTTQAMLAGGVATLLHDFVMTPMDTMKQRMQLGHYDNLRHAFSSIVWGDSSTGMAGEGWRGLYRSFPVTVMTNVPYGMIMMTTNEWLRGVLEDGLYGIHQNHEEENPFHFATILLSGMGAGTIASAATAPLDRIKTRLQTQRMGMVLPTSSAPSAATVGGGGVNASSSSSVAIMEERALAAARGEPKVCPKMAVQDVKRTLFPSSAAASSATARPALQPSIISNTTHMQTPFKTYYTTPLEAFQSILQEEGPRGLFRGTLPRVALHAPSVAISWTAYEMAKDWLVWMQ